MPNPERTRIIKGGRGPATGNEVRRPESPSFAEGFRPQKPLYHSADAAWQNKDTEPYGINGGRQDDVPVRYVPPDEG
jgi:hypothetical protein